MTNGPQIFVYVNDPSAYAQHGSPGADSRAGNGAASVSGSATMAAHLAHAVPLAAQVGHPAGGGVATAERALAQAAGHRAGGGCAPCVTASDPAPAAPAPASGAPERLDPHATHRDFPHRWRAFIRAHYRDLREIQLAFGVSERTARKWMAGETGCNGGNVAVAVHLHPEAAPQMLFAA